MSSSWLAVAPFDYADRKDALQRPVELSRGVTIGPRPAWILNPKVTDHLSEIQRLDLYEATFAFALSYEAASIGDRQRYARELIALANLALWLVRPTHVGYELLFHFQHPGGESRARQTEFGQSVRCHPSDVDQLLTRDDLTLTKRMHEAILDLPRGRTLHRALHFLSKALIEGQWESRYVFLWIVIEALYGPADAREMTFRMSQRAALFLETTKESRDQLFKKVRQGYSWRSKLVHGANLAKLTGDTSLDVAHDAETLIRRSFLKILEDTYLTTTFDRDERESYLDGLAFCR